MDPHARRRRQVATWPDASATRVATALLVVLPAALFLCAETLGRRRVVG
jgi:hypothetical protein